jgi:hypothetical protein
MHKLLAPTHQMVKLARISGFDNVHDYLIHVKTGETASKIAKRKFDFDWGQWLLEENDIMGVEVENEEENVEENVSAASPVSSTVSLRRQRPRSSLGGAGDGIIEVEDKGQTQESPSSANKRLKTSQTIKKSTGNVRTAKVVVDAVETPAKTTPMATRRNTRSSAARGLAMTSF